jgi:drug/metabolite transporter (DMT)-like permease
MEHTAGQTRLRSTAIIALLIGAVGIAVAPICVRLSEVGPISSAFWRVVLATPILFLLLGVGTRRAGSRTTPGPLPIRTVIALGIAFAADLSLWHWSIGLTTVANSTLLCNLAAVFVTIVAWLSGRERITAGYLVGLMLALIGAATMIGLSVSVSARQVLGDAVALTSALMYAGYLIGAKSLRAAGHPTLRIMAWVTLATAVALLPVALLSGETMLPRTLHGWTVLLMLAVISHTGGQTLIAYALAHLPATFSSAALLLQPVLATLFAWLLFDEALGPVEFAGALTVLAGIAIAGRGSTRSQS